MGQTTKRNRFTDDQIIGILKEHETGVCVADLCCKHGVIDATIYKWRAKYGSKDASTAKPLKGLEDENARPKRLLADAMLDNRALKYLLGRKWWRPPESGKRSPILWRATGWVQRATTPLQKRLPAVAT